jgi:hypothetical protein
MSDVLFGGPSEPFADAVRMPTRMRVLITVKAAPVPSTNYGETVCVAGLRLDSEHEGWVRLYPINFRHIESNHVFRKYDVVTVDARPASEGRSESWRPAISSLTVEAHLDKWDERMLYLGPYSGDTMCDLNARSGGGPSLGLVRAREVLDLVVTEHDGWKAEEQAKIDAYMAQGELFDGGRPKTALEPPPYRAAYRWICPDLRCKGHLQGILDWEIVAFQRNISEQQVVPAQIRRRWLDEICRPANDVYFYVGNQAKRRNVFSVLGVVYPRR